MIGLAKVKFYDTSVINQKARLFSNRDLRLLMIPIIIEQLLNSFMGMADTMMVSNVGNAAISAVSLVDSINNFVIQVFYALSAGAAIICSQYLGNRDEKGANKAARQVVFSVTVISIVVMAFCLLFRAPLLHFVFGDVEADVMKNSMSYFFITVLSYPFLALFDSGGALFRASGNSKFPMMVALLCNGLHIIVNAILIFVFHMGVEGAAISTLFSRFLSTVIIFVALYKGRQVIKISHALSIRPDMPMIYRILSIGVPAGVENGMFQFGKLAIQSTVSTLGTVAIAAQAMTIILEMLSGMVGMGIGIGLMTVVGQCIGAGRKEEAKFYMVKLSIVAEIGVFLSCVIVFLFTKPVLFLSGMHGLSASLCLNMVLWITIIKPLFWVLAFVPAYGLRAAGDVKFSMSVSTISMWFCRVALCVFLIRVLHFGPIAVWIGMFADWGIRGIIFSKRFLSGKWCKSKIV